jgi:hypothetical protein
MAEDGASFSDLNLQEVPLCYRPIFPLTSEFLSVEISSKTIGGPVMQTMTGPSTFTRSSTELESPQP